MEGRPSTKEAEAVSNPPPPQFVERERAWLTNRLARVKVNGTLGRSRNFKEGLPQASFLPPLLFIIFINDFLGQFEDATLVSAHADDLAIVCQGHPRQKLRQDCKER